MFLPFFMISKSVALNGCFGTLIRVFKNRLCRADKKARVDKEAVSRGQRRLYENEVAPEAKQTRSASSSGMRHGDRQMVSDTVSPSKLSQRPREDRSRSRPIYGVSSPSLLCDTAG